MFVTDNLEGALSSKVEERLRQFALALTAIGGSGSGGVNYNRLKSRLDSSLGVDLNSLLTVNSVNDNSIKVRMGAVRRANKGGAIVPRNHYITVLVLVPDDLESRSEVTILGKSTFRHSHTGRVKAGRETMDGQDKILKKSLLKYNLSIAHAKEIVNDAENLGDIFTYVVSNNFTKFSEKIKCWNDAIKSSGEGGKGYILRRHLWVDLIEAMSRDRSFGDTFEIPSKVDPKFASEFKLDASTPKTEPKVGTTESGLKVGTAESNSKIGATIFLYDDPNSGMVARVPGGSGLARQQLRSTLTLMLTDKSTISLNGLTHANSLDITFPSLAAFNFKLQRLDTGQLAGAKLEIEQLCDATWEGGCTHKEKKWIADSLAYRVNKVNIPSPINIVLGASTIVLSGTGEDLDKGTGIFHIVKTSKNATFAKAKVMVSSANLIKASLDGAIRNVTANNVDIDSYGKVELDLGGLVDDGTVNVSIQAMDANDNSIGSAETLSWEIKRPVKNSGSTSN